VFVLSKSETIRNISWKRTDEIITLKVIIGLKGLSISVRIMRLKGQIGAQIVRGMGFARA